MHHLLDGLNAAQREAVTHVDGPVLVLAGPGSGKTRVITYRIAYLIAAAGVPAEQILAVTFTNKAADEMARRLAELTPNVRPWACTFHRFCARIIRRFADRVGRTSGYSILDQRDRLAVLTRLMKAMQLDTVHYAPDRIEQRISGLKNELVSPEDFCRRDHGVFDRVVSEVYGRYQARLREQDCVDFDDLLVLVAELLRTNEDIRALLDRRYRFVLVDEYQDTNLAQYAIARALSLDAANLCVSGDPDQSIYSWRGADLRNILCFEDDFPGARVIRLEQNYRSTRHILASADRLIRNNRRRVHKDLVTDNPVGNRVVVVAYRDDAAEAEGVAESIRLAADRGRRRFRDCAVFIRTGSLSRAIEDALKRRGIAYQVIGGMSFYEHKEIRDLLAYARLLLNPRDDAAFERIVNVPPRGIGETTVGRLRAYAHQNNLPLREACRYLDSVASIGKKQKVSLRAFVKLLDEMGDVAKLPPNIALETILDYTGYRKVLEQGDELEQQSRLGNVADMLAGAREFAVDQPDADLRIYLEAASLTSDADARNDTEDLVTVMTLHAAKGLEFALVFIIAFEQGILPHERSVREGNEEEERRLMFVGITRAKEELYISYAKRRHYQGKPVAASASRFLLELPAESLDRKDMIEFHRSSEIAAKSNLIARTIHDGSRRGYDDHSQENGFEEPSIPIERSVLSDKSTTGRFHRGMLVEHPRYGQGQIVQIDGDGDSCKATIRFVSGGNRRFVLNKAPLQPV